MPDRLSAGPASLYLMKTWAGPDFSAPASLYLMKTWAGPAFSRSDFFVLYEESSLVWPKIVMLNLFQHRIRYIERQKEGPETSSGRQKLDSAR